MPPRLKFPTLYGRFNSLGDSEFFNKLLVLLDINLPDMQGTEVAQKIRQSLPLVKIVLCSLSDASEVASQVKACGADAYISKLTPIKEFHQALAALIESNS